MRVVATAPGYIGHYREIGEEFDVPEGAKASWFTPVKRGKAKADAEKTEETSEALV